MSTPTEVTYLNTAACGLLEQQTVAAGEAFTQALSTQGSPYAEQWRKVNEPTVRATVAAFIGAPIDNVAIIPNFSWAMNAIVQALKGTERVLLYKNDYPSLFEPFRINHFDIHWVDASDGFTLPMEDILSAIRTKAVDVVALSHVQYNSGYLLDIDSIAQVCREHGVMFIVDATQSLGAVPVNIATLQPDVLIASNYKWMNAGFGTGILYISDSFMQVYPPVVGGHNSYKMQNDVWAYTPSVLSYEPGHPNMYGQQILQAAIQHKDTIGVANIQAHNNRLTSMLLDSIKNLPVKLIGPATMDNRCSIILLKDENRLWQLLKDHNIITTNRNGMVRISMHYYNTEADITKLVEVLQLHK